MQNKDTWDVLSFSKSPIIQQLKLYTDSFSGHNDWPTISDYIRQFELHNINIKPVPQSTTITCYADQYEPRVYLKGELQTRTHNWHDFFNALVWLKFPITKKTLNSLHYKQSLKRDKGSNRSLLENRITQFDECGAVIISNNKSLLALIKGHNWLELFIQQKKLFSEDIVCVIFGHAIFEKALNPYIGLTCHCLLIEDNELLSDIKHNTFENLDRRMADIWETNMQARPTRLQAYPVLGTPGYWHQQNMVFYQNKKYFR